MRRHARRSLLIAAAVLLVVLGIVAVANTWSDRAREVCQKNTAAASGYTVEWDTGEFAYVCDYTSPQTPDEKVSIVDAFHGDGRPHGPR